MSIDHTNGDKLSKIMDIINHLTADDVKKIVILHLIEEYNDTLTNNPELLPSEIADSKLRLLKNMQLSGKGYEGLEIFYDILNSTRKTL